jgi:hypothetical protein
MLAVRQILGWKHPVMNSMPATVSTALRQSVLPPPSGPP